MGQKSSLIIHVNLFFPWLKHIGRYVIFGSFEIILFSSSFNFLFLEPDKTFFHILFYPSKNLNLFYLAMLVLVYYT